MSLLFSLNMVCDGRIPIAGYSVELWNLIIGYTSLVLFPADVIYSVASRHFFSVASVGF